MKKKPSKQRFSKQNKIRLGVNIDHVATLRQVRGGTTPYPDLLSLTKIAVLGGADQITIHLREDRRHIQESDVVLLTRQRLAPINLEMGATSGMLAWALKTKPNWVCLVPEKREELTTEGGLDVASQRENLREIVAQLKKQKIQISGFIEPRAEQIEACRELEMNAVEFHTGAWVLARGKTKLRLWKDLVQGSDLAHSLGMHVHAGHGLDFESAREICALPHLEELNIGHSLICYALEMGLKKAVQKMKKTIRAATI